jgi:hypothetical protein
MKGDLKMKNLKINENATLTTEHSASHYNIPVLVTNNGRAYGPSDRTYSDKFANIFNDMRAAHTVYSYAINNELDTETLNFVKLYLGQWPEGPQIEQLEEA